MPPSAEMRDHAGRPLAVAARGEPEGVVLQRLLGGRGDAERHPGALGEGVLGHGGFLGGEGVGRCARLGTSGEAGTPGGQQPGPRPFRRSFRCVTSTDALRRPTGQALARRRGPRRRAGRSRSIPRWAPASAACRWALRRRTTVPGSARSTTSGPGTTSRRAPNRLTESRQRAPPRTTASSRWTARRSRSSRRTGRPSSRRTSVLRTRSPRARRCGPGRASRAAARWRRRRGRGPCGGARRRRRPTTKGSPGQVREPPPATRARRDQEARPPRMS